MGGVEKSLTDLSLLVYNTPCVKESPFVKGFLLEESGCGSVWLERLVWDQEAAGSNPVTPIFKKLKMAASPLNMRAAAILRL